MELYEAQTPHMYSVEDYQQKADQVSFRVGPCKSSASKKCVDPTLIASQFAKHNLNLALSQYDD